MAYDPRPEKEETTSNFVSVNAETATGQEAELMKDVEELRIKHNMKSLILIGTTWDGEKSTSRMALTETPKEPFFLIETAMAINEYYLERVTKQYKERHKRMETIFAGFEKLFSGKQDN